MNWLLLRGLGREKRHWYKFPEQLEASLAGGKVLTLNSPGLDDGDKVPITISDMVDVLRNKWLESKKTIAGDWGICAVSLGGMFAIDWAHRYPDDFKRLVIINSSSQTTSPLFHRIKPRAISTLLKALVTQDFRAREHEVLKITTNIFEINNEALDYWEDVAKTMKLNRRLLIKQLLAASRFKLPKELPIPAKVLAGKKDNFTNYKCSENIAKFYKIPISYHENAGHDLPNDDPNWVIENIIKA